MVKILFLIFFLNAAFNNVQCGAGDERLPAAIEDADYEALYNALLTGRLPIIKRNINSRRMQHRLATGKYIIKELEHPITGQVAKYIASVPL